MWNSEKTEETAAGDWDRSADHLGGPLCRTVPDAHDPDLDEFLYVAWRDHGELRGRICYELRRGQGVYLRKSQFEIHSAKIVKKHKSDVIFSKKLLSHFVFRGIICNFAR